MSVTVKGLSYSYGAKPVIEDISFEAAEGELVAVLGPNGAGKSTLFKCILGILPEYRGEVLLSGTDARRLSARELAGRAAYIPQSRPQAFSYSALEMTLMGAFHATAPFSSPGNALERLAMDSLGRVGMGALASRSYATLSGGEQQLVLIARALTQGSRTLIMDEPTSSLDYGNRARIISIVRTLADEGYTALLSTHDPQQALWHSDRALVLNSGRVAAFGKPEDVITAQTIMELYRVPARIETAGGYKVMIPGKESGGV